MYFLYIFSTTLTPPDKLNENEDEELHSVDGISTQTEEICKSAIA